MRGHVGYVGGCGVMLGMKAVCGAMFGMWGHVGYVGGVYGPCWVCRWCGGRVGYVWGHVGYVGGVWGHVG